MNGIAPVDGTGVAPVDGTGISPVDGTGVAPVEANGCTNLAHNYIIMIIVTIFTLSNSSQCSMNINCYWRIYTFQWYTIV